MEGWTDGVDSGTEGCRRVIMRSLHSKPELTMSHTLHMRQDLLPFEGSTGRGVRQAMWKPMHSASVSCSIGLGVWG